MGKRPMSNEQPPSVSETSNRECLLEVDGLRTYFKQGDRIVRAVDGVSFDVRVGEIVAIVGESGSGKTVTGMTIMRLIAPRLVSEHGGSVRLRTSEGEHLEVLDLSERQVRRIRGREIGIIFQDPMTSLNPVFTVGSQIVEGVVQHSKVSTRQAKERAKDLLRQVGLGEVERLMGVYPHELSGGMRQRVMIAIALASDPQLLIADEPTTALDVTVQAQIVRLLRKLAVERGMGVIFITHDLALVAKIADRVCVMYAGEVIEQGPAAEVFTDPLHPYTTALAGCIPQGPSVERLTPIPGQAPDLAEPLIGCRFAARCPHALPKCSQGHIDLRPMGEGRSARCVRIEEIS